MQNRIRSDPYRTTLVCIDSAQEGLLTGRVYHPYLPSGAEFKNLMQFLLIMEDLLDKLQFPQSFTATGLSDAAGTRTPSSVGKRTPHRKNRHIFRAGDLPAKRQLARIGNLAGGRKGREFPQRAGVGSAHAQCHQSGGHAQPGPNQRLSRRSGPTVRFVGPVRYCARNTCKGKPYERAGRKARGLKRQMPPGQPGRHIFDLKFLERRTKKWQERSCRSSSLCC